MIHIIPINDLEEHIESSTCKCNPTYCNKDGEIIIHNSFDGRELLENKNNQLLNG